MIGAAAAASLALLAIAIVAGISAREGTAVRLEGLGSVGARADRRKRAHPPWRALTAVGALVAGIVGYRIAGIVGSLAAVVALAIAPRVIRRRRARRRARQMQEHLADAVALVASAMRSGRSLLQAIELSAGELDPSFGATFRRLVDRVELGDPMDAAIDAWASDVGGPDARLVSGVLKLHRQTGGSL